MPGNINFSQKEIDGVPVSGTELDRYLIQGDQIAMNPESLLKLDSQLNTIEIPVGLNGQVLKVVNGSVVFSEPANSLSHLQDGYFEINGLTINWSKVSAIAPGASSTVVLSKPFTTINFGVFSSVEDPLNNIPVQVTGSTLTDVTIKNFDALNTAATVYVFSIGV